MMMGVLELVSQCAGEGEDETTKTKTHDEDDGPLTQHDGLLQEPQRLPQWVCCMCHPSCGLLMLASLVLFVMREQTT